MIPMHPILKAAIHAAHADLSDALDARVEKVMAGGSKRQSP